MRILLSAPIFPTLIFYSDPRPFYKNAHPRRNAGVRETTPTFRTKNRQTAYSKKNSLRNEASSSPQRNTRSKKTIRLIASGTKPNCGRRKTQLRIRKAESLKERAAQKIHFIQRRAKKSFSAFTRRPHALEQDVGIQNSPALKGFEQRFYA